MAPNLIDVRDYEEEGLSTSLIENNTLVNYKEIFEHISVAFKSKINVQPTIEFNYDFSIDTLKDFNAIKKIAYYLYKNKKSIYKQKDWRSQILRLEDIIESEVELGLELKDLKVED